MNNDIRRNMGSAARGLSSHPRAVARFTDSMSISRCYHCFSNKFEEILHCRKRTDCFYQRPRSIRRNNEREIVPGYFQVWRSGCD